MHSKEELWKLALPDLVEETLPKAREAHGEDYAAMARAILDTRIALDAVTEASAASRSAHRSARLIAIATVFLVIATLILAAAILAPEFLDLGQRSRGR